MTRLSETIPFWKTDVLGLDCEMVGVGRDGAGSALARVSIVNKFGYPIYDKFVSPREVVTDYRTACSGIRPSDLEDAPQFTEVQAEVADILKGRIVVGHDLSHDFKALLLEHPEKLIRDTSKHKPFIEAFDNRKPSLKKLAAKFLRENIQSGEHNSVKDAWAAVRLYKMFSSEKWEEGMKSGESSQTLDFLLQNHPILLGVMVVMAVMAVMAFLMAVIPLLMAVLVGMVYLIPLVILGFIVFCSWKSVEGEIIIEHTNMMGNQNNMVHHQQVRN